MRRLAAIPRVVGRVAHAIWDLAFAGLAEAAIWYAGRLDKGVRWER